MGSCEGSVDLVLEIEGDVVATVETVGVAVSVLEALVEGVWDGEGEGEFVGEEDGTKEGEGEGEGQMSVETQVKLSVSHTEQPLLTDAQSDVTKQQPSGIGVGYV